VVVYLWGDYSVPDQKWLAEKVVGMQERFAKQPIIFMTVCHSPVDRDDPKQLEKQRMRILEVLTRAKATLQTFLLDEDDEVWREKLGFVSGPTFNVYDARSTKVRTFSPTDADTGSRMLSPS